MDRPINLEEQDIRHILLWMPHWLGDVVFSLPTIQALRARLPHVRITAVAHPPAHEFLSHHPSIDSVIKIPYTQEDGFGSACRFARSLKKYQFDLAVLFPNSFRSAMMAWLSGAKTRIGYQTEGRGIFLTHPLAVQKDSKSIHGMDYYSRIVSCLGINDVEKKFEPIISEEEVAQQEALLAQQGIYPGDFKVAIQPGASKQEKRWHPERFGILCQKLIKERGAKILLLGSNAESELIEKIRRYCPREHSLVFTGQDMRVVLALLRNCQLLIANDSGLMNLGAMVGTPLVALFGPGSPKTSDPCIEPAKKEIVSKNFPCSPCRHNFFKDCKPSPHNKPFCIEDISVKDVSDAVDQLLERIETRKDEREFKD
jgi:lipopolysaccharide heptosyltransferase II